jgi:TatD DNase family protein
MRELARTLPLDALVVETDAPDIPPQWIYRTAEERAKGQAQGRNSPTELPRIAQVLADLRGMDVRELQAQTLANARRVMPGLERLA